MRTITVSAANANREFSKLLRSVREGARVTITSHGRPVAELRQIDEDMEEMKRGRVEALARLDETQPIVPTRLERWSRDELYGDIGG